MIFERKYCTDQNIVQFVNFSSNGKLDCEFVLGDIKQFPRYSMVIITRLYFSKSSKMARMKGYAS